ncbi:hypothetical protein, partial [Neisseria gonorrhoeae]|uniref:hypothetical protein n=1 Tax=Neisseria gonorrhoeae TaxID=485 RepID=UPI00155EA530
MRYSIKSSCSRIIVASSASSSAFKSRRERGFDDLLLDVHTALTDNPHAETPARAVAENWEIALID